MTPLMCLLSLCHDGSPSSQRTPIICVDSTEIVSIFLRVLFMVDPDILDSLSFEYLLVVSRILPQELINK